MLDRFFESYYRLRPVNATFTGIREYDDRLPDWSPEGLEAAAGAMESLRRSIAPLLPPSAAVPAFPDEVDLVLADAYLGIQLAELATRHFLRGNPALYTGEAAFSVIGLCIRLDALLPERLDAAVGRMQAIPRFLDDARRTLALDAPAAWIARARRECEGAAVFFTHGLPRLLDEEAARLPGRLPGRVRSAAEVARAAFARFDAWLAGDLGEAEADRYSTGPEFLDLLVTRGHLSDIGPPELLARAREEFTEARACLHDMARAADPDGWPGVQEQLAQRHPTVETYLPAYHRAWEACRQAAADHDLVTWQACPVRYGPIPRHTRDAAPFLYYLHYRSPAPFEKIGVYDYVVTPIDPQMSPDQQERLLRTTNDSVIKLNHVVHHGAIGHHVQNHRASRSASRIGQVAAVDCASRIGMFSGGTLAEGWACYATDLMEEIGFLTALERVAEQHSRVRQIGRTIVDIQLHSGTMSFEQAVAFYRDEIGLADTAARGEATRNSMFPGTALMYWLGVDALHRLRRSRERADGAGFSLGRFHDRLLSFGAIPVPLIARLFEEQESGIGD